MQVCAKKFQSRLFQIIYHTFSKCGIQNCGSRLCRRSFGARFNWIAVRHEGKGMVFKRNAVLLFKSEQRAKMSTTRPNRHLGMPGNIPTK